MVVSQRAARLVQQLDDVSGALIALIDQIPQDLWERVARPGEWSPGKDAEHVAEGNAMHQWLVRSALHQKPGTRPAVERARCTAEASRPEVIGLLKQRVAESRTLVEALTDEQLARPCRTRTLEEFIDKVLVGHMRTHQAAIEDKRRRAR